METRPSENSTPLKVPAPPSQESPVEAVPETSVEAVARVPLQPDFDREVVGVDLDAVQEPQPEAEVQRLDTDGQDELLLEEMSEDERAQVAESFQKLLEGNADLRETIGETLDELTLREKYQILKSYALAAD